jgi:hypothetical protein
MTTLPPATCDRCAHLVVECGDARCSLSMNRLITDRWQPGDARPAWCARPEPVLVRAVISRGEVYINGEKIGPLPERLIVREPQP